MTVAAALSIATSGLANINSQLALTSQNVANASTPGYAAEVATEQSVVADGMGLGVRSLPATRDVDAVLQAEVFSQNATVTGLQTRQSALQAIDAVQGTPGQNGDLASLLGNLQNQFSTLLNDPSSQAQQSQVVSAATNLAQNINTLSNAYTAQRQSAQDGIVTEVATLNATLGTIGGLSDQIVSLKSTGQSTADLENQRDAAVATLSQLVSVKVLQQPNGDVLIVTSTGQPLPIHGTANPLSTSDVNVLPGTSYPGGGIPPIMLGGVDVTKQLQDGQIGVNIALRDATLPTDQAELDEFAQNLASRFDAQGLTLFTDPTGNVPSPAAPPAPVQANYVGFAGTIQVNPLVLATPSLVRDGTSPLPPAPQPAGGNTGIIQNVLTYTFGSDQAAGVPQPPSNTRSLGPAGTLNAPYTAPSTLGDIAATMLAAQAQESATTSTQADTEQAVQTTLTSKLSTQSGVNMDTEMSHMIQLQNAYGANAKIIAAVQAMWTQLLQSVT
ncbi:MAG TPA: flagellar hook-associated protein FlgK [Acetobacteraceae bacterium]|nr:flagellar hook-associated protein FlgK [Acetobacteraceae bacterium]